MSSVTIRLLGGFSVEVDGSTFGVASFERRSGADLIAVLALQPGRRLHRERVLDALWPDAAREAAMGRLNKAATFARRALDRRDAVVVTGDTLTLFPDAAVVVDVEHVNEVPLHDEDAVVEAARWCGGELLPDLPYEEWTVEPRNRLHVRQTQVLRSAKHWQRLLDIDPTDEAAHVALMREDLERGDRDGALRRFKLLEGVLDAELGVVPGSAARELRDRALDSDVDLGALSPSAPSPAAGRANPVELPRTRTFGRDLELAALRHAISDHRVVTLVGPGGAGKTHLARRIGGAAGADFPGGAWFAELGRIEGGEAALQTLLDAIGGLRAGSMTVTDAVVTTLADRDVLVVLDNCEHVRDAIAEAVDAVVAHCPKTRLLVTSREPLGVEGELVHRLEPLTRPAAVELFAAEAGRLGTRLDPADPAIERICARLDDLPMAVRLAAARARSLDLGALEALLADRFDYLTDSESGALDHQQTLRTTIGWSVNALGRVSRRLLVSLSVFADSFGLDDVAAVVDASPVERLTALDDLVRRSLLFGPESTDDGPRYRLLESVRLFAREELGDDVRRRHVEHLAASAALWNATIGSKDNSGLRGFANGFDDLRVALGHALDLGMHDEALTILTKTALYANTTMRLELLEWYRRALDPSPERIDTVDQARAYAGWSVLATYNSDFETAERLGESVIAAFPRLAEGQWAKAWLPWTRGDLDAGRYWCQQIIDNDDPESINWKFAAMHLQSIIDFAAGRDVSEAAMLLDVISVDLGASARSLSLISRGLDRFWTDGEVAIAAVDECIDLSDAAGLVNTSMTARSLRALAYAVHRPVDEALGAVRDTQRFAAERGLWSWVLAGLGTAAAVFEAAERPDAATMVLSARLAADYGSGFTAGLALLQTERLRDGHAEFDAWWSAGQHLSPADAGSFAVRTAEELLAD